MTASHQGTPDSLEPAWSGWSELLPRYVLIEELVRGRRVLDVGTTDLRPLVRLCALGAARVAAISPQPELVDRSLLHGRRIELLAMELERLAFEDRSFDLVLVPSWNQASDRSELLSEIRRVLAPDGAAMICFSAGGRTLGDLVTGRGSSPAEEDPRRLAGMVRRYFPDARFYRQVPFVGVALLREGSTSDAGISLDQSLSPNEPEASHVLALAGHLPALADERTLVELPLGALEAHVAHNDRDRARERERLLRALELARQELVKKNASLQAIGSRLPPLRAALEAQLRQRPAAEAEHPQKPATETLELRQSLAQVEAVRGRLEQKLEVLTHELERERGRRRGAEDTAVSLRAELERNHAERALIADLASSPTGDGAELTETRQALEEARASERAARGEIDRMARLREADLALIEQLEERASLASGRAAELEEAQEQIVRLERTVTAVRSRAQELERALESQPSHRAQDAFESRAAEERIASLERRLEVQALERAQEAHHLLSRCASVEQALAASEHERETLRARLLDAEREVQESTRSSAAMAVETGRLAQERQQADSLQLRLDQAMRDAHQASSEAQTLRRQLADREHEVTQLLAANVSLQADRGALELAAAELNRSAETLRARVQELRTERDTLARASELLLSERDIAAGLAKRALDAEQGARDLATALDSRDRRLDELEAEIEERVEREGRLATQARSLEEHASQLELRLADAQRRLSQAEREALGARDRLHTLDQQLARAQQELGQGAEVRSSNARTAAKLEEALRDAAQDLRVTLRESLAYRDRVGQLERSQLDFERQAAESFALRARAEAEATSARGALVIAEAERRTLEGDLKMTSARLTAAEAAWRKAVAERKADRQQLRETEAAAQAMLLELDGLKRERVELEEQARAARRDQEQAALGLARTLEEAAGLYARTREVEAQLSPVKAEAERLAQAAEEAQRERERLTGLLADHERQLERLGAAKTEADGECRRLTALLAEKDQQLEAAVRRAEAARDQAAGQDRAELDRLSEALSAAEAERQRLEVALDARLAERTDALLAKWQGSDERRVGSTQPGGEGLYQAQWWAARELLEGKLALAEARSTFPRTNGTQETNQRDEPFGPRVAFDLEASRLPEIEARLARAAAERARADDAALIARAESWDLAERLRSAEDATRELEAALGIAARRNRELEDELAIARLAPPGPTFAATPLEDEVALHQVVREDLVRARAALAALELEHRELLDRSDLERRAIAETLTVKEAELEAALSRLATERSRTGQVEAVAQAAQAALEHAQAMLRELSLGMETERVRAERTKSEAAVQAEASEAALAKVRAEAADLSERLEAANARLASQDALAETFQQRVAEVLKRAELLARTLETTEQARQAALASLAEARQRITELEAQPPTGPEVDRSGEARAWQERLREVEERALKAEGMLGRAEATTTRLEGRAAEAEARANKAEEAALRAERSLSKVETRAEEAEKRATASEARAHHAETRLEPMESKVKLLESRAVEAEARAQKSEQRTQRLEGELRVQESRARVDPAEHERAKRALDEAQRRQKDLETQLAQRTAELAQPRALVLSLEAQLEASRQELEALRERLREATARTSNPPGTTGGIVASLRARCESLEAAVSYRDAELQRLKAMQEKAAAELDEARADVGRKVTQLRSMQLSSEELRRDLGDQKLRIDQLKGALARQGDAAKLAGEVQLRDQEIGRINAQRAALEAELRRLYAAAQSSEEAQAKLSLQVAELENSLAQGNHRTEMLKRELAEKSERLRRLSGVSEP